MTTQQPEPIERTVGSAPGESLSSSPRGAAEGPNRSSPRGSFPTAAAEHDAARPEEAPMTAHRFHSARRIATRAAIVIAGVYLAFAVGAPWFINHAPPTAQDVVASAVCSAKAAPAAK
jgi:hypothetical protein